MVDEKHLSIVASGSLDKRASSSVRRVLDERMTLSEAIEAATTIIGRYPNGGRDAGDSYIGGLAAMLGSYPRQVALRCADPVNGIVRACKFLPTPADIVSWCDRKAEPLFAQVDRESRIRVLQIEQQNKPSPEESDRVGAKLRELADSLKRALEPSPAARAAKAEKDRAGMAKRQAQIIAEWTGCGETPPTIAGVAISRELHGLLIEQHEAAE